MRKERNYAWTERGKDGRDDVSGGGRVQWSEGDVQGGAW